MSTYGATNDDNNRRETQPLLASLPAISSSNNLSESAQATSSTEMRSLNTFEKVGFGLGHIYNDLCAGVWFSYTLLFLQGALRIGAKEAGILMMLGQVGDAIATPVIGLLADKYGTKRLWHIAGKRRQWEIPERFGLQLKMVVCLDNFTFQEFLR